MANESFERYLRFGRYQLVLALLYTYWCATCASVMSMMSFAGKKPTVVCHSNSSSLDTPSDTAYPMLQACPLISNDNDASQCQDYTLKDEFVSATMEWELICERISSLYLVTTLQMLAVMVGAPTAGWCGDKWGRKRVLLTAWTIVLLLQVTSSQSVNLTMFTLLRIALGLAVSGVIGPGYTLFVEFLAPADRFKLTSLFGWSVVYIAFGGLAWLAGTWRNLEMYAALLAVPGLLISFWLLDESPRWLIQHGRTADAEHVLQKVARRNGRQEDQVKLDHTMNGELVISTEIVETKVAESEGFMTANTDSEKARQPTSGSAKPTYHFYHLCYSWKLTRYTVCMAMAWFTTAIISYGVMLNIGNLAGSAFLNMSIFGLARYCTQGSVMLSSVLLPRVGRKPLYLFVLLCQLCSCLAIAALQFMWPEYSTPIRVLNLVIAALCAPCWVFVALLTAELYPTPIRNLSNGSLNIFARIGASLAPQALYIGDAWAPWATYLIFACALLISICLQLAFLDETRFSALPERMPAVTERVFYRPVKVPADELELRSKP